MYVLVQGWTRCTSTPSSTVRVPPCCWRIWPEFGTGPEWLRMSVPQTTSALVNNIRTKEISSDTSPRANGCTCQYCIRLNVRHRALIPSATIASLPSYMSKKTLWQVSLYLKFWADEMKGTAGKTVRYHTSFCSHISLILKNTRDPLQSPKAGQQSKIRAVDPCYSRPSEILGE